MTPAWAWPLAILGALGWALFGAAGIIMAVHYLRKHPPPDVREERFFARLEREMKKR